MFYADLSPYAYLPAEDGDVFTEAGAGLRFVTVRNAYRRLNVGWLESGQPWTTGSASADFVSKLLAVLDGQGVNQALGLHECDLCPVPLDASRPWYEPRPGHRRAGAGTGEIRVPGAPGTAYAAPQLIGHYVADHGYLPPREFVDAVLAFDLQDRSAAYPAIAFPWIPDDAELYDALAE
ncbi:hypothetical protein KV205_05300 [Streptomyces sp. SKN60]|uniref:DUF7919 family protein n=1 Tax=Streptomyces sp. SKN60 TaxID=2855506 RepID=UPI002245460E|nr:hypothetical protein [Streptomyces sp. SKN60]MCX2179948.1 hypothetical protein [Streptomyces sp. SKN60]